MPPIGNAPPSQEKYCASVAREVMRVPVGVCHGLYRDPARIHKTSYPLLRLLSYFLKYIYFKWGSVHQGITKCVKGDTLLLLFALLQQVKYMLCIF